MNCPLFKEQNPPCHFLNTISPISTFPTILVSLISLPFIIVLPPGKYHIPENTVSSEPCINGITLYEFFCLLFPLESLLRVIHVMVCNPCLRCHCYITSPIWLRQNSLIHSAIDDHLGCAHFAAPVSNVVRHILVHASWCIFASVSLEPRYANAVWTSNSDTT